MSDMETEIARSALALWGLPSKSDVTLLNYSENHTFLVTAPNGARTCLRLHRPRYQSQRSIASELAWLSDLAGHSTLRLPRPIAGQNGQLLQSIATGQGARHAVLFDSIEGKEPLLSDDLVPLFGCLGAIAGQLHAHSQHWVKPTHFERLTWGEAEILDPDAHWGDWRLGPDLDHAHRLSLDRLDLRLRAELATYGRRSDRFGLIHADMRLGNLLVDGDAVALIDFDDCGFSWFGYDFAAAISFHETDPRMADIKTAWLTGYKRHRTLEAEDIARLDTLVMLRRMALLAWIGSHHDTDLARTHRKGFAEGTAMLAERYLENGCLWVV